MASEMDDAIRAGTNGSKSLGDALRFMIERTARVQQQFEIDQLPDLINQATGVDVGAILDRWLRAPGR